MGGTVSIPWGGKVGGYIVRCSSCGVENPRGFTFCGHCGSALPALCPWCGLTVPAGFTFCGHCGAHLANHSTSLLSPTPLEGERRFVAVLFADIAGFVRLSERLDAEEATAVINCCLEEMLRIIVQHGGRVDKYMGDGVMAVFGAPASHEDDAERALRTALAMQEAVSRLHMDLDVPQLALKIGLACGRVVAAWVGGQGRREYTVIGPPVNLAYRLHEVGIAGQILVSEEMARLVARTFTFRPVVFGHLHGWDGEMLTYELLEERPGTASRWLDTQHSPLVGRDAEMSLLWRCLEELDVGRGGLVSVIGEAGLGKTRLLREAWARVHKWQLKLNWLEGAPLPTKGNGGYGYLRALLRGALGLRERVDAAQVCRELAATLARLTPQQVDRDLPYLCRLLDVPLPPSAAARLEGLDAGRLKQETLSALRNWLRALADQQPLVLALDDLQCIDPLSAELLEPLLSLTESAPLLIVAAYRPEPDRPAWLLREVIGRDYQALYTELWLQPLFAASAETLVRHLLHSDRVPEQALRLILERTEGNPLFVEEVVRSMVDQRVLVQLGGAGWELSPGWEQTTIPSTLQGILQARLDRLDESTRSILQVASCIGCFFSSGLLAAVLARVGKVDVDLALELAHLVESRLIEERLDSPEREYVFRHVIVRDMVYDGLLRQQRDEVARLLAQVLEPSTGVSMSLNGVVMENGHTR